MFVQGLILVLLLAAVPINSLSCYDCSCDSSNQVDCTINCGYTIASYEQDYCVIIEQRYIDTTYIDLYRIPRNATWLYVNDTYFILVVESISYNSTTMNWNTSTITVLYGCDWDLCNSPSLINVLPNSFLLSINNTWLDTNIYGTGSVDSCHTCLSEVCVGEGNPFNSSQCPLTTCVNVTSVI
jgi:hypothetical protein